MPLEFEILGPLEARDGDRRIALRGVKLRLLLAVLVLHANEVVPSDRLVDAIWGDDPPDTAAKALQMHVSQLRKLLEPERSRGASGEVLLTRPPGYLLRVDAGQLDFDRFERAVSDARAAAAAGRHGEAARGLRGALALWRGSALADLRDHDAIRGDAARMDELRLRALEDRIDADLAIGDHAGVVVELEALVAEHPLRERLRAQLMLALYRCGRQADALEVYRDTRRVLVDELGIEPGRELRDLERAILAQDPALDSARPAAPSLPASDGLVGRRRELRELLPIVDRALAGAGAVVLIGGEPGIGKSRLAETLARHAHEGGARVAVGRCWEAGGAPAYWPWQQALRAYAREVDPEALCSQLGGDGPELAAIVPELAELVPGLPAAPRRDEGARFRLFRAVASFLRRAAAAAPVALFLDDLHAGDSPSLVLLEFMAAEVTDAPILIVGCYRDTEVSPGAALAETLPELARAGSVYRVALSGLGEADTARLLERVSGRAPTPALAARVYAQTDGNPLFAGEIGRLLVVEGGPRRIAIPASVRDAVMRRLHHVSEDCRRALTLASVLGREFELDPLARVSEQELEALLDLLGEASSAGVIGDTPGAHGRLRFAHVVVRDALYYGLTATTRMRLHRRVGEALEAVYANNPEPHLAELAHHFYEAVPAGDAGKAVHYARRAGDLAAARLAYEEAARLYGIAIETVESHAAGDRRDRCELLLRLGDVQARAGDVPSAKDTFLLAADLARQAALPEQFARAALGYGGRFVWARAWGDRHLVPLLEEALSVLPVEDSVLRVRVLARLAGGPLRDTVPPQPREAMSQEAVDMARRLGDPATLAYALNGRYSANWGPDVHAARLAIAEELIQVARRADDLEREYEGRDCRFWALIEGGDMRAASAEYEAKARLANELRQPAQLWDVAVDRAMLALFEGRLREAEAAIPAALALGRSAQSANAQLAFDLQTYALRREQGRLHEVVEVVERAAEHYAAYPVWRFVRADVYAELGRRDDAEEAFDALGTEGFSVRVEMQWLFSISLLPEVCRYLGDARRAATLYELLLPYARRNAVTPPELCRGSVSRGLGILAATISGWDRAVTHFEAALRLNHAMGARPWLAHTSYDYARMLLARAGPGDRDRAREHLDSAAAVSRELGMSALAEKVSAVPTA